MCSNDYTCIKSQGFSVVDYYLVPHEDLGKFTEFKVHKVSDLINEISIISSLEPETYKPDHFQFQLGKQNPILYSCLTIQ